jgi:hypothetical protein
MLSIPMTFAVARSLQAIPMRGTRLGGIVKLLLTSGGITNTSIRDALVDLLGKPVAESSALCVPTAQWGHPNCGPVSVRGFASGAPPWGGMTSMEWKSLGLLELTALPTIGPERWATGLGHPAYVLDDQSAIKVSDGTVEVVSEGQWRLLSPPPGP